MCCMKKLLTVLTRGLACCSLLISCNNDYFQEPPPVVNYLALKEIHYNFETGVKIGEKALSYDSRGLITREYFISEIFDVFEETRYEYDIDGNLLKKMTMDPMSEGKYFTLEYTYVDGLKKSESMSFDGVPTGYQTQYFHSDNEIDSSRVSYYSTLDNLYHYIMTTFYDYDTNGRMVRTYNQKGLGATVYRYLNDNLAESCDVIIDQTGDGVQGCVVNEYNDSGQLIKVSEVSPWWNMLKEEFFYKDGRLDEKKVYIYPAYEPGNTIDITLIKFEY
jgi:hypothetical protein